MKFIKLKKLLAGLTITATLLAPFSAYAITFPTGRGTSGDLTISGSRTEDSVHSNINTLASAGASAVVVASASGFTGGDYIFIIQSQGTGVGNYEIRKISTISSNTLNLAGILTNTYQSTGAQVIKINEYHTVTVASGGTWTASGWNGTVGGVLVALTTNGIILQSGGTISASSLGFRGGPGTSFASGSGQTGGYQGEGENSIGSYDNQGANGMGGGGGHLNPVPQESGGGGGGYASSGGGSSGGSPFATGGSTNGTAALSTLFFGGGAGSGGHCCDPSSSASGQNGGGIIFFTFASTTLVNGTFTANGGIAGSSDAGGGAGGSIKLDGMQNLALGSGLITSSGGAGHSDGFASGGGGGDGRISVNSTPTVTGTSVPSIDTSSADKVTNLDNNAIIQAF